MKKLFYTIRKLLINYNASPPGIYPCGLQLFSLEQYDPFRFPSYAGLAYVINRLQLQTEKANTYTANGMEKKRNRVTQNTAVTAHFEGRCVECQIVTDLSQKSILTGPFHSEDGITTLLRNVRRHSVTPHKT